MTRALAIAVLLAACDHGPSDPWERELSIEGRVVALDGAPVSGASVELVSPDYAEIAPSIVATVTTDAQGRFRIEHARLGQIDHLNISSAGVRRMYPTRFHVNGPAIERLGDVPFSPNRELLVTATCPRVLNRYPLMLDVTWRRYLVVATPLLPTDGTLAADRQSQLAPPDPLSPGRDAWASSVPPDAHHFERRIEVPIGPIDVHAEGACGELTTRLNVPAEGEVPPLVLTFPAQDEDSLGAGPRTGDPQP